MRDRWSYDRQTNARGLVEGIRLVKDGIVKIGGDTFKAKYSKKLEAYEGKKILVSVADCWASEYTARDPDTYADICRLH